MRSTIPVGTDPLDQLLLINNMEAVGVESADKLLLDRHFNDLENISRSVFLFHAICVSTTAYSLGTK